jgi:hypothetical protein
MRWLEPADFLAASTLPVLVPVFLASYLKIIFATILSQISGLSC